jgi:hypothetical protein
MGACVRRDKTGTEKWMKEVYIEGVASHDGPDDVADAGNGGAVAGGEVDREQVAGGSWSRRAVQNASRGVSSLLLIATSLVIADRGVVRRRGAPGLGLAV